MRLLLLLSMLLLAACGDAGPEREDGVAPPGAIERPPVESSPVDEEAAALAQELAGLKARAAEADERTQALVRKELALIAERLAALERLTARAAGPEALARYRRELAALRRQTDTLFEQLPEVKPQATLYFHRNVYPRRTLLLGELAGAGIPAVGIPKERAPWPFALDGYPTLGNPGALSPLSVYRKSVIRFRPDHRRLALALQEALADAGVGPIRLEPSERLFSGETAVEALLITGLTQSEVQHGE